MYEKLIKIMVATILAWTACVATNAELVLKRSAKSLSEVMPARVVHLFNYWPDAAVLSGPNRVSGDENRWIALVKKSSVEWTEKVLSHTWLPAKKGYLKDNLIMIRNEFDEFDVTHVQWTKNGYNVRVSQTASIIIVKLIPLASTDMGETPKQKREFAKELCRQIFNNTGMRYGIRYNVNEKGKRIKEPVKVPVKNLAAKICDYSFRPELVRQFPEGIVGVAPTQEEEGLPWIPRDGNDVNAENREDNPNWDKSRCSWSYWWRHVCWWHDGKSIGFFTLKREAGAMAIDYWGKFGTRWFEGPKSKESQGN